MSKDKVVNDQCHIIQALKDGNFGYVWTQVKNCGWKYESDINIRYAVFCECIDKFDCEINNNFIKYFIDQLKYRSSYNNKTFYVSNNRSIIRKLQTENISPTDCSTSKITKELKKWSN